MDDGVCIKTVNELTAQVEEDRLYEQRICAGTSGPSHSIINGHRRAVFGASHNAAAIRVCDARKTSSCSLLDNIAYLVYTSLFCNSKCIQLHIS